MRRRQEAAAAEAADTFVGAFVADGFALVLGAEESAGRAALGTGIFLLSSRSRWMPQWQTKTFHFW